MSLFLERVTIILEQLPFRSFPMLKGELLMLLEEFHNQDQDPNNPKPFNPKTCSKHWWFEFLQKNPVIKPLWDNLPLERSVKKHAANSQCSTQGESDSDSDIADNSVNDYSKPFNLVPLKDGEVDVSPVTKDEVLQIQIDPVLIRESEEIDVMEEEKIFSESQCYEKTENLKDDFLYSFFNKGSMVDEEESANYGSFFKQPFVNRNYDFY